MKANLLLTSICFLSFSTAGCGNQEVKLSTNIPAHTAEREENAVAPSSTPETKSMNEPVLSGEDMVQLAVKDLSKRLDIAENEIFVEQVKPIEWPDATLGCPKPGMDFSPMLTPGYIITLEVDGKEYVYHTDDVDRVILCPAEGERPDNIFIMP